MSFSLRLLGNNASFNGTLSFFFLFDFTPFFFRFFIRRGSCMVWEINMGVCPRLDFENIMLFNCLGYNFNIYGAFEFLCNSIANL